MSAVMTPRRPRRGRRTRPAPAPGGQSALFGAGAAPAAPAAPGPPALEQEAPAALAAVPVAEPAAIDAPEAAPTARAHRHGPTLDDLVAGAWEGAGAPADCLVCGAPLAPRHSAGAGIVGGRCGGCGTTVS
jgi:hypothetical protein